MNISYRN